MCLSLSIYELGSSSELPVHKTQSYFVWQVRRKYLVYSQVLHATCVYAAHSFAGPLSIGRHPPPPILLQGMLTPNLCMTESPDTQHHRWH